MSHRLVQSTGIVVAIGTLGLVGGCAGETPRRDVYLPPPDQGIVIREQGLPPDTAPTCSATGVATNCDPMTNTGCTQGDCYVTKQLGSACVCPAGTGQTGDQCNTTTECAPQSACAGTVAPGNCSPLCDPEAQAPACPADTPRCMPITNHTQWGICKPAE